MTETRYPNILCIESDLSRGLLRFIQNSLRPDCLLVWVSSGTTVSQAESRWDVRLDDLVQEHGLSRSVLVVEGTPLDMANVRDWRRILLRDCGPDIRCFFFRDTDTPDNVTELLKERLPEVFLPIAPKEAKAVGLGDWVKPATGKDVHTGSDLMLTMFFDSLGELLTQMEGVRRRFQETLDLGSFRKADYVKKLERFLELGRPAEGGQKKGGQKGKDRFEPSQLAAELNSMLNETPEKREAIPRVLLLGETGVGKTVIANYLGREGQPVTRVSIAEFSHKEDMFEYELFGYARGGYTGALAEGRKGLLLDNIGGVLFLDEIGTATPVIQTKLLAYLDDFRIRPRGAEHSLFCPVLIVAATNEVEWREGGCRRDLFQRFTDVHEIPPLRKLKHNFPYIVDAMLQKPGVNAGFRVKEVGEQAFRRLQGEDYADGNFRELEQVMRQACRTAVGCGRTWVIESDLALR